MKTIHAISAIRWHLENNISGLSEPTIDKIVSDINALNTGTKQLTDNIAPGVTLADMLQDLKIDII